jgi:hypothetical protein
VQSSNARAQQRYCIHVLCCYVWCIYPVACPANVGYSSVEALQNKLRRVAKRRELSIRREANTIQLALLADFIDSWVYPPVHRLPWCVYSNKPGSVHAVSVYAYVACVCFGGIAVV